MAFKQERQSAKLPQLGDSYKNADVWPPKKNKQSNKKWGKKKFIGEKNPYQSDLAATRNEVIIPGVAVGVGADYFSGKNQEAFRKTDQYAENRADGKRQYKGYAKHYLKSKIKQIGKLFQ